MHQSPRIGGCKLQSVKLQFFHVYAPAKPGHHMQSAVKFAWNGDRRKRCAGVLRVGKPSPHFNRCRAFASPQHILLSSVSQCRTCTQINAKCRPTAQLGTVPLPGRLFGPWASGTAPPPKWTHQRLPRPAYSRVTNRAPWPRASPRLSGVQPFWSTCVPAVWRSPLGSSRQPARGRTLPHRALKGRQTHNQAVFMASASEFCPTACLVLVCTVQRSAAFHGGVMLHLAHRTGLLTDLLNVPQHTVMSADSALRGALPDTLPSAVAAARLVTVAVRRAVTSTLPALMFVLHPQTCEPVAAVSCKPSYLALTVGAPCCLLRRSPTMLTKSSYKMRVEAVTGATLPHTGACSM